MVRLCGVLDRRRDAGALFSAVRTGAPPVRGKGFPPSGSTTLEPSSSLTISGPQATVEEGHVQTAHVRSHARRSEKRSQALVESAARPRSGCARTLRAGGSVTRECADTSRGAIRARQGVRFARVGGPDARADDARHGGRINPPVPSDIVSRFLDNACPDHHVRGGADHVRAEHTALRLLERYPEIAHANFYTAVVCGDLEAVKRALAADPGRATRAEVSPARAHRRWWRGRSLEARLGPKRMGAALVPVLHAPVAGNGFRQRRRDRAGAARSRRRSERLLHGRRQPLHAAGRRDRRRRRGPTAAPAA